MSMMLTKLNCLLQAGSRSGVGVYVWPTGARYRGEWKDGYMHGVGTLIAPNGAIYQVHHTLAKSLSDMCNH